MVAENFSEPGHCFCGEVGLMRFQEINYTLDRPVPIAAYQKFLKGADQRLYEWVAVSLKSNYRPQELFPYAQKSICRWDLVVVLFWETVLTQLAFEQLGSRGGGKLSIFVQSFGSEVGEK